MRKYVVAAIAIGCASLPAQATTFINFNGSTGVFGNNQVASTNFSDTIDLGPLEPGAYLISATISTTYQDGARPDQDIDFTSVMLNGVNFSVGTTGQNEFRFINNVVSSGTNLFTILGTSGANSSYAGTINVATVAEVPEPSTWAMMLIGFFAIGAALRRRPFGDLRLRPSQLG